MEKLLLQNFSSEARIDDLRVKPGESDYTTTVRVRDHPYITSVCFWPFGTPPTIWVSKILHQIFFDYPCSDLRIFKLLNFLLTSAFCHPQSPPTHPPTKSANISIWLPTHLFADVIYGWSLKAIFAVAILTYFQYYWPT